MDPYVGKYFSVDYIRRQILKQTDTEIKEIDDQIKQEMADGIIADPAAMEDPMVGGEAPPAEMAQPPAEETGPDPSDLKRGEF